MAWINSRVGRNLEQIQTLEGRHPLMTSWVDIKSRCINMGGDQMAPLQLYIRTRRGSSQLSDNKSCSKKYECSFCILNQVRHWAHIWLCHFVTICCASKFTGKKCEHLLQVPVLQRIVAAVEDFPQCCSKAPFVTLQCQVVWGNQQFWGHPGDPVNDHYAKKTSNMSIFALSSSETVFLAG